MSHLNSVALSGNLTADPELRYAGADNDFAIVNLRVANERSKKVGEEWASETSFFDVTVFGRFGELVARKARTGDLVAITGRLEQQRWEKDGEKRSKVVVIADQVEGEFKFRKADGSDTPAAREQTSTTSQPAAATAAAQDDDIPFQSMLLRVEVSTEANQTGDERGFRRGFKAEVAQLAATLAQQHNVELNRIQVIANRKK